MNQPPMTQLSLDRAPEAGDTLICGLTPSGRIDVRPGSPEDGPRISAAAAQRILGAFNAGRGHGVLHLGAGELGSDLHPTLSYWRDIGQALIARVCGAFDASDPKSLVVPDLSPDEVDAYLQSAPPMQGAELITPVLLAELWTEIGRALSVEAASFKEGVAS